MSDRFTTPALEDKVAGGFKVPKPRILSGDGDDRDPERVEAWIKGIRDYYQLVNLPKNNQAAVLQFSLENTALEFYNTKRDEAH